MGASDVLSLQAVAAMLGMERGTNGRAAARRYLHARGAMLTTVGVGRARRYAITRAELERVCPQFNSELAQAIQDRLAEIRLDIERIKERLGMDE